MGAVVVYGNPVFSAQFFCELETTVKNNISPIFLSFLGRGSTKIRKDL